MKKFTLLLCLLLGCQFTALRAQPEIGIGAGYSWLEAEEWDNILQTYNFSRPWLEEEQTLPGGGLQVAGQVLLPADHGIKIGALVSYATHSSEARLFAVAPGTRSIDFTVLSASLLLEFHPFIMADSAAAAGAEVGDWYYDFFLELGGGFASVQFDAELQTGDPQPDQTSLSSSGSGFDLLIGGGYAFHLATGFDLRPYFRLHWMPGIAIEGLALDIHNSNEVGLQNESTVLQVDSGLQLRYHF